MLKTQTDTIDVFLQTQKYRDLQKDRLTDRLKQQSHTHNILTQMFTSFYRHKYKNTHSQIQKEIDRQINSPVFPQMLTLFCENVFLFYHHFNNFCSHSGSLD